MFAIIAWQIWNNRNKFKHEGKCKESKRIVREVRDFGLEIQETHLPCPSTIARVCNQWKPLRQGRYKVNVDGVFASWGWCSVGVVIRNENGLIMGAMSKKLPLPLRATEVEVKAVEEGIKLAWDLGLTDIDLESDAQVVVGAVVGNDSSPCSIQKVVKGEKLWLKGFRSWSCAHVRRHNNMAAHILVREAFNVTGCVVWVEDTPNVIANQIHLDVNAVDSLS